MDCFIVSFIIKQSTIMRNKFCDEFKEQTIKKNKKTLKVSVKMPISVQIEIHFFYQH